METNKQVVKYDVDQAAIAKMADIYMHLKIDDLDDKDQFAMVHSARMVMVKHRARVDKIRVAGNKEANEFIRGNNKAAVALVALMAPIEAHLTAEEKPVLEKEKRIKAEKAEAIRVITQDRVEQLQAVGYVVSFDQAGSFTINDFLVLLGQESMRFVAEKEKLAQEKADRKAEDERLAGIREEQEAEAAVLATQKKRILLAQKKIDDEKAAIEAEKAKISAEKIRRAAAAEKELKRIAQKKIDDEIAQLLAFEKIERDKQAEIDKEKADEKAKKRQEALRPDKEKLKGFGNELLEIRGPELKDPDMKAYLESALDKIYNLADNMIDDFDL